MTVPMLGLRQIQLKLPLNEKIPLESEKKQMITMVTITAQILDLLQSFRDWAVILRVKSFISLLTFK
jgi:hypothetical protein